MHYKNQRLIPISEDISKNKGHLQRLGDCPYKHVHKNYSQRAILLIAISNVQAAKQWVVRAAAWARHSFFRNTDASEQGVQIGLYIQDAILNDIQDILEKNHIISEDVFPVKFEDNKSAFPLKHYPFCDERFLNYDYVMVADADYFACSNNETKDTYFADLMKFMDTLPIHPVIGVHKGRLTEPEQKVEFGIEPRALHHAVKFEKIEAFKHQLIHTGIPSAFVERCLDPSQWVPRVSGGFYIFSMKKSTQADRTSIKNIADIAKCDESTAIFWYGMGKPLVNVVLGRKLFFTMHRINLENGFYFYHSHADNAMIYKWLKGIGGLL